MPNGDPVAWTKLVKDVGFPIVVSILLMGALFGWIPTPLLTEHRELVSVVHKQVNDNETNTFLLRQICWAVNKEDKHKCFQDGPSR